MTGSDVIGRDQRREEWEADERFQQLVELAPDAILIHDGECIVLANAAAVRLSGAGSREQLVGLPIDAFLAPPYLKAVQSALTDSITPTTEASPVRDTFRRLDGAEVEVEVRAIAFMDQGRPAAHLIIRDMTGRLAIEAAAHQMEERLEQAQRMEAVGALAGGVAHEVNNMMGVVLGFSDFLLRNKRLPEDCLADVREVMKAADRAALVTRQLLSFSRRAIHRPQTGDLGNLVRAVAPVVRQLLSEGRRLVLVANTDGAAPVWVDPGQLEQVIVNLALNARDAMEAGGTLTITTGEREIPGPVPQPECLAVPPGQYATLAVSDTGTGIDADIQARIFEPFFTTKPLGQGTGLGLAAVHGIVKQHDGCITVQSAPGQGTTFTIYFPIIPTLEETVGPGERFPAGLPQARSGGTVLVIDDEPAVRSMIVRTLEESGFRAFEASDGGDALEQIAVNGPPNLVLTDLTMPGMGGAELARVLRERWPALPILFMSGYSAGELDRQGTMYPGGELIAKPFAQGALVERVTAALVLAQPEPAVRL